MADEINLTYETLFDITRKEKMQDDLQKLDSNFFPNLIKYLSEKSKILDKEPTGNVFVRDEQQIARKQLENIRRLVSELYSRRERKIINLAIIKSRTNSKLIDTSVLLPEEKVFFNYIFALLNHSKKNILYNLLQAKTPIPLDASVCFNIGANGNISSSGNISQISSQNSSEMNNSDLSELDDGKPSSMMIKFLSPVQKFVGKELEMYGPYDKDDIASLPSEIAEMLLSKGKAEEITK